MPSSQTEAYPPEFEESGEERLALIQSSSANSEYFRIHPEGPRQEHEYNGDESEEARTRQSCGEYRVKVSRWCSWPSKVYEAIIEAYRSNVGLLLIMLSQFCSSCMNISVKILNGIDPPVPPFELVIIRMLFTYVFSVGYMYYYQVPHIFLGPPGIRRLLVFRGVSGFFGLFGMYYSLQYLSLSDAVVLTFLTPTVTAIASHYFLGESFSRKGALAGLFSLVGVILIARPEFLFGNHTGHEPLPGTVGSPDDGTLGPAERGTPGQRLGAVGVSLLGVLGATGAVTSLRAIGKRAHAMHSLTYFSSYSIIVATLGMIIFRIPVVIPQQWKWVALFFVIGFFGYGTQVTLVLGLQRETASRGMLAMYIQIIFATILERIFFHVYPSTLSVLGSGVIISCAIYIALSKVTTPIEKVQGQMPLRDLESGRSVASFDSQTPYVGNVYPPEVKDGSNGSTIALADTQSKSSSDNLSG